MQDFNIYSDKDVPHFTSEDNKSRIIHMSAKVK